MAIDVNVDSGSYTDETLRRRSRLAEAMMKAGLDTSPISSHYQGLARLANALIGGYMSHKLDQEAKDRDKTFSAALLGADSSAQGLSGSSNAYTATPSVAAASGGGSVADPTAQQLADKSTPAAIRTNNPGAMWPGPSATKFGSTEAIDVAGIDPATGKRNKAAVFKAPEDGAAAQFDLLSRGYAGKTLRDALAKWSGGNNVDTYVGMVSKATGLRPDEPITPELLRSPKGLALAKVMAQHESGRPYPLDDAGWSRAQARAFGLESPDGRMALGGPQESQGAAAAKPAVEVAAARSGVMSDAPGAGAERLAQASTQPQGQVPTVQAPPQLRPEITPQIRQFLSSPDPKVRALGQQMAIKALMSANKQLDQVQAADLALKQMQLLKAQADIKETESKLPKSPEETGKQFAGGLEQLQRFPEEFGKEAFERALGPWQATDSNPESASGVWGSGISVQQLGQQLARGIAEAKAAWSGGAAPTEVRDRIETAMKNLAAVMKPLVRKPGEGAWSDKDQANLEAQIGTLTRSRSVEEYSRRLEDIKQNVSKIFLVPTPAPETTQRSPNAPARAGEEKGWAKQALEWINENTAAGLPIESGDMKRQRLLKALESGGSF